MSRRKPRHYLDMYRDAIVLEKQVSLELAKTLQGRIACCKWTSRTADEGEI